jgi:hypothetical protein
MNENEITKIINPETVLERTIISTPEFIEGALWGKPRNGHPEGSVIAHIGHVLSNVDKYSTEETRLSLRLVAIIHDSFKYKVDRSKPKGGENHHAMIARRFAEKYINDPVILDLIELHDEAYNSWCKGDRNKNWNKAEERAWTLVKRLGENIELYLTFYQCDNETGDKNSENFQWFKKFLEEKVWQKTNK